MAACMRVLAASSAAAAAPFSLQTSNLLRTVAVLCSVYCCWSPSSERTQCGLTVSCSKWHTLFHTCKQHLKCACHPCGLQGLVFPSCNPQAQAFDFAGLNRPCLCTLMTCRVFGVPSFQPTGIEFTGHDSRVNTVAAANFLWQGSPICVSGANGGSIM